MVRDVDRQKLYESVSCSEMTIAQHCANETAKMYRKVDKNV